MIPFVDIFGYWIGIFLTFAILSYLYKDNPFYKFAEHLFVGVSIGFVVTQQYYNVLRPNLIDHFADRPWYLPSVYWIPLVLVGMLFIRGASRKLAWLGRYPIGFVVALYAGLQINAVAESDLAQQIAISTRGLDIHKVDLADPATTVEQMSALPGFSPPLAQKVIQARQAGVPIRSLDDLAGLPGLTPGQKLDVETWRGSVVGLDAQATVGGGGRYWFGMVSRVLLLVGLLASLVYFYFSIEQKGLVKPIARFGVYTLMIGFGASFGYTVQGRLALAVGRAMDVLDKDKSPELAAQLHGPIVSVVVIAGIIVGIVVWETWWIPRQARRAPPSGSDDAPPPEDDLPAY